MSKGDRVRKAHYYITVNGQNLDEDRKTLIQSIKYENTCSGSDLLTIDINDPDQKFLGDNIFTIDCPITLEGGWLDGEFHMQYFYFFGYISMIDANFPENGTPKLTIHCMDNSYLLNKKKKKRTWKNIHMSDVIAQIYREHGLNVVIDPTTPLLESVTQQETDIAFIKHMADEQYDDYIAYVKGNTGYFVRKPQIGDPKWQLDYRQGNGFLLSFSPRVNKSLKKVEIDRAEVNIEDKGIDRAQANDSLIRPISGESVRVIEKPELGLETTFRFVNGKWVKK